MNWNFVLVGALALAAGGYYYSKSRKKSTDSMTFSDYCLHCEEAAAKELNTQENIIKQILVLALVADDKVAPYFYRRHADGKLIKKRVNYNTFDFSKCPADVKESIVKGEYIIKKY